MKTTFLSLVVSGVLSGVISYVIVQKLSAHTSSAASGGTMV